MRKKLEFLQPEDQILYQIFPSKAFIRFCLMRKLRFYLVVYFIALCFQSPLFSWMNNLLNLNSLNLPTDKLYFLDIIIVTLFFLVGLILNSLNIYIKLTRIIYYITNKGVVLTGVPLVKTGIMMQKLVPILVDYSNITAVDKMQTPLQMQKQFATVLITPKDNVGLKYTLHGLSPAEADKVVALIREKI